MVIQAAYYRGTSISSFRKGEQAEIIGVKMVTPESKTDIKPKPRPCLHVRYLDGTEDYTPIINLENRIYRIGAGNE